MTFLEALDALQGNGSNSANENGIDGRVIGIYQEKNPTNILIWDRESIQFRTFYTHKPQVISSAQLFAKDWEIIIQPALPEEEFMRCLLN